VGESETLTLTVVEVEALREGVVLPQGVTEVVEVTELHIVLLRLPVPLLV
jgi:hypothetical protein